MQSEGAVERHGNCKSSVFTLVARNRIQAGVLTLAATLGEFWAQFPYTEDVVRKAVTSICKSLAKSNVFTGN